VFLLLPDTGSGDLMEITLLRLSTSSRAALVWDGFKVPSSSQCNTVPKSGYRND
jgi:hypothetical protein